MAAKLFHAALAAGLLASACATPSNDQGLPQATAEAEMVRYEVTFYPQDNGLTWEQIDGLTAVADEYKARGHGPLVISYPQGAGNQEIAMAGIADARSLLFEQGLDWRQLVGAPYDASGRPMAPVIFTFNRYRAVAPNCDVGWDDMTREFDNLRHRRFGCAMEANLAAMVADPRDLITPRDMEPGDTGRRQTVIEGYRAGQNTATQRGEGESGAVSQVNN